MKWIFNMLFKHQEKEFKLKIMSESLLKEQKDAVDCLREVVDLIKEKKLRIRKCKN